MILAQDERTKEHKLSARAKGTRTMAWSMADATKEARAAREAMDEAAALGLTSDDAATS